MLFAIIGNLHQLRLARFHTLSTLSRIGGAASHVLIATLQNEFHPTLRHPNPLPKQPQHQHQNPRRRRYPRLGPQHLHWPIPRHPINLHIRGHEAANGLAHGNPRAYLATALRIRIQEIGVDRDGRNHDACDLRSNEDGDDDPVVDVLEGEAEDKGGNAHDRRREPDDDEAGFGLDVPGVPARVVGADGVVDPVA